MMSNRPARVGAHVPRRIAVSALALLLASAVPGLAQDASPTPAQSEPTIAPPSPPAESAPPSTAPAAPATPQVEPAAPATPATPPAATEPTVQPSAPATAPATNEPAAPAPAASQPSAPADPAPQAAVPLTGVEAGAGGNATLPHDLSPWGMFMSADIVVKAVMVGLAFASVVTWTIWFAKVLELALARRRAQRGLGRLEEAETLGAVEKGRWAKRGPVAALVRVALFEAERSAHLPADGVKERTAIALQRIEARAGRRMTRGTGLLATIGSTAPFVGLFGTVWGIMNSFIGISQANTTNLAVVAPGIAEALLATAIGLVAAIPAVVVYNVFSRAIAGYRAVLADASAEVLRHLSRDLDRQALQRPASRLQAAE